MLLIKEPKLRLDERMLLNNPSNRLTKKEGTSNIKFNKDLSEIMKKASLWEKSR